MPEKAEQRRTLSIDAPEDAGVTILGEQVERRTSVRTDPFAALLRQRHIGHEPKTLVPGRTRGN